MAARRLLLLAMLGAAMSCDRAPVSEPPALGSDPAQGRSTPSRPSPTSSVARPVVAPLDAATADAASGPRAVDPGRLARLVAEAEANGSTALFVSQHGRVLEGRWWSKARTPIQTMSVTKSVLALAAGCLVEQGKLAESDPVSKFFPAAGAGGGAIHVAHLLTHSSGLDEGKNTGQIYAARDFVEHALRSARRHPPGTNYTYGNRASNLLSGVMAKAAGVPADELVKSCLFEPLGVTAFSWSRDKAGNAHGLAGLHMLPEDLHKLGMLVVGEGTFEGKKLLDAAWVRRVTSQPAPIQPPNKPLAGLWWRLPEWTERVVDDALVQSWRQAGVDGAFVDRAQVLVGKKHRSALGFVEAWQKATEDPALKLLEDQLYARKLPDARYTHGPILGTYAHGSLGQFLVVVPEHGLIAVRMRRAPSSLADRKDVRLAFPDFPQRVVELLQ